MVKIKLLFLKIKYFFNRIKLNRFWKKVRKQDYICLITFQQFQEKNPRSHFDLKYYVLDNLENSFNINTNSIRTFWSNENECTHND